VPEEKTPADVRVRRSVARTLGNGLFALIWLAALGAWAWLGVYQLQPGQAAVLLRLGEHVGTVTSEGLHWTLPPPFVSIEIVNVAEVRNEDFGLTTQSEPRGDEELQHEASMQTSDNNIVRVSFSVQYRIKDAFAYRFRLADPIPVVRDAAQAAMREAVGRMTVDGVWRERRDALTAEVTALLQEILDSYDSGLDIQAVELQDVQPPVPVQKAFADVIEANQDAIRLVNEAEGFRNQTIPSARAESIELLEGARGYREARVAAATGEAARFTAIAAEHAKAPEVTRKRLYLETLEQVLPDVHMVIVEKGATQVLPLLPLEPGTRSAPGAVSAGRGRQDAPAPAPPAPAPPAAAPPAAEVERP
jgi:membrane protease subunit HflK